MHREKSKGRGPCEQTPDEDEDMDQNPEEVFNRLNNVKLEGKDWAKLEQDKAFNELKECTFVPSINQQHTSRQRRSFQNNGSRNSANQSRSNEKHEDPYERLYSKHKEQELNRKQKEMEKLDKDMEECSFAPQRITKNKD